MEELFLKEAETITRYLVRINPKEKEKRLYVQAMLTLNLRLSDDEQKTWAFMQKHPWSYGFIDAALAVTNPESTVRRKIYTMLAILEANPTYCELFLPRSFSVLYFFKILFTGLRSVVRLLIGLIILRLI